MFYTQRHKYCSMMSRKRQYLSVSHGRDAAKYLASCIVIDTATNTVSATIAVGVSCDCVAITPDGAKAYVGNAYGSNTNTISVIDTSTNTVTATISISGTNWPLPRGIAFVPDGSKAYVALEGLDAVCVIDTSSDTVSATITVGNDPFSIGQFIQPAPSLPTLSISSSWFGC